VHGPDRPTLYLKSDTRSYTSAAVTVFPTVYPPLPVCSPIVTARLCHSPAHPSCPILHVRLLRVGIPRTTRVVLWKLPTAWHLVPCRARVRT
jgi:hypothetical protein